jgi:glycosyltransferase involved in cell wall biosynthesis
MTKPAAAALMPATFAAPAVAAEYTVIIPAYMPSPDLVPLVRTLGELGVPNIVVIDDGSGVACQQTFESLATLPRVTVLHHAANLGKGAALKTGFNYAAFRFPTDIGFVTADADGQHLPEDILRVAGELRRHPESLVMGARQFAADVPFRSRVGNIATRRLLRLVGGLKLTDTQTGLRGVPASLVPALLHLQTSGYDFELDMLLLARQRGTKIREIPIRTVYLDGNASSHFNPLLDSARIYAVLFRFTLAAFSAVLIDCATFALLLWQLPQQLFAAQCLARVVSLGFNYAADRQAVPLSGRRHAAVFPRYVALSALSCVITYCLLRFSMAYLPLNALQSKFAAELTLFAANVFASWELVFTRRTTAAGSDDRRRCVEPLVDAPPVESWAAAALPADA